MKSSSITLQIVAFMAAIMCGPAAQASDPLFEGHEDVTITLTSDFKALFRDREARDYFDATLQHANPDGSLTTIDLSIRLRGNFRVKKRNCRFPPLRLNFKTQTTKDTLFDGQDILKLVTHCRDRDSYQDFLFLEYLTYMAWTKVTEASFRVRLVHITYVEASDGEEIATRYGFLIEHKDALAARLNALPMRVPGASVSEFDKSALAGMTMFQFFAGNTDWSTQRGPDPVDCCHNVELLQLAGGRILPVPYDFDHAGLVNASYAEPAEELQIRSVRTRLYRGFCSTNDDLDAWAVKFLDSRPDIYELFEDGFTPLGERRRLQSLKFIDGFYEIIESENAFQRQIRSKCR